MPSNAELAEQLKAERAKNKELEEAVAAGTGGGDDAVLQENEELKTKLVEVVASKEEMEASLTAKIAAMSVPEIVNGETSRGIKVMTAEDYSMYSKAKGTIMGRKLGQKTECSIEELRALINSHWTPKMVMEKHGLDADDLQQLVWQLSKRELRDKPIKYSIERDVFGREG